MSTSNNVNGISVSMKSTQSFSVTAFEGGSSPAPAGGCEPADSSSSASTSGSQASFSGTEVKKLAGELKAITSELGNKPTCGCAGKSPAPTSGASPAPTSGAPSGSPPPGGADQAGPAGQPGQAAQGGKKSFQEILQGIMQILQKAMKSFGMQGA
jgi:hypothetical protein